MSEEDEGKITPLGEAATQALDPRLQAWFARADDEPGAGAGVADSDVDLAESAGATAAQAAARAAAQADAEAFTAAVMARLARRERLLPIVRWALVLLAAVIALPLQDPLEQVVGCLLSPLLTPATQGLGEAVSPLSSLGAVLMLALLGVHMLLRRLRR